MNTSKWLIPVSEIKPGASAILGENYVAFFTIQILGIVVLSFSLIAGIVVLSNIWLQWKRGQSGLEMSVRFPMYFAVIDMLWGISNLVGHFYLVIAQTIPESKTLREGLSVFMCIFFGWMQIFRLSISLYTYFCVIHGIRIFLGHWEWRLHFAGVIFTAILLPGYHFLDSFGYSGYWFSYNAAESSGWVLGVGAAVACSLNATVTAYSRYTIKKRVQEQREKMSSFKIKRQYSDDPQINKRTRKALSNTQGYHSTAIQCLSTYVSLATCLHCPLAVLLWIYVLLQITWGVIEPFTALLIVMITNSYGWANAYGYFYNIRVKKKWEIRKYVDSNGPLWN